MYLDTSGHISTFKIPPFGFVLQSVQVADTANSRQSPKNIFKSEFCPKQLMRQIYGLNCNVLLLWHFLLQNPCFKLSKRSHVKISPKLLCHVGRYVRSEQHFSHILCCPHDCLLLHEQCLPCGPRPIEEDKLLLPEHDLSLLVRPEHNALEVSLANLGLDLAFCRHTLHLGNNITYSAWLGATRWGRTFRISATRPYYTL